jgi:N-acetylmuramoyl-L-alanine amidase
LESAFICVYLRSNRRIQDQWKNLLFAWQMQKALVRGLGTEDRGVRRARFAMLRDAPMPAVLI